MPTNSFYEFLKSIVFHDTVFWEMKVFVFFAMLCTAMILLKWPQVKVNLYKVARFLWKLGPGQLEPGVQLSRDLYAQLSKAKNVCYKLQPFTKSPATWINVTILTVSVAPGGDITRWTQALMQDWFQCAHIWRVRLCKPEKYKTLKIVLKSALKSAPAKMFTLEE